MTDHEHRSCSMQQLSGKQYIDGTAVPGVGARRDVIDPATEAVIAHLAEATADEVEARRCGRRACAEGLVGTGRARSRECPASRGRPARRDGAAGG